MLQQASSANYIENRLTRLSEFTDTPGNGITRLPFSKAARDCVDYLTEQMSQLGLSVHMDGSGAVIGRLEGETDTTVMIGSHYDSVMHGGAYDGIAGVVCGMAAIKRIVDSGIKPHYSIEICAMNDEEGARFKNGFFSSLAMLGEMSEQELKTMTDSDGITVESAMREWGLTVDGYMKSKRDLEKLRAFLEVHIEQGPVLESNKCRIGVVNAIVGMERYLCEIYGRADHAGTTPMNMRKDALAAATKVISGIGDIALSEENSVATVGYMDVYPNQINTIAQKVSFTLDIRSVSEQSKRNITDTALSRLDRICSEHGLTYKAVNTLSVKPTYMNEELKQLIRDNCLKENISFCELNSGAGHDSLPIGKKIPTAMIFVPTKNGASHCPEEFCRFEDLATAAEILCNVIINLK